MVILEFEENCCCCSFWLWEGFSAAHLWQTSLWQVSFLRLTPTFAASAIIFFNLEIFLKEPSWAYSYKDQSTKQLLKAHSLHWESGTCSHEANNFYEVTRVSPRQVSTDCICLMKPSAEETFLIKCTVAPLPVFFILRWRHRITWAHLQEVTISCCCCYDVWHTTWN